jgi:NTE family protein
MRFRSITPKGCLSVGAVNIETGQFAFSTAGHGKLPGARRQAQAPGFPPIEVDGEEYWDGGLVSNTPLQYMVDYFPRDSRVIFQVDLFPARARHRPTTLDEVHERDKDIRYSSRTRLATSMLRERHDVRHAINELECCCRQDRAPAGQAPP